MKRIFLTSFLILSMISMAKSQVLIALVFGDKLNSPKTEFGLNVGANYSTLQGSEDTKYSSGVGIGMFFTWKFHDRFQLQPEFFFTFPGGAKKLSPYGVPDPELEEILSNSTITRKSTYFSFPVHIKYRVWNQLRISFAPQVSFLTSNEDRFLKTLENENDIIYRNKSVKNMNRFDFGLSAGLGFKLKQGKGVNLEARYYFGMVNTDNGFLDENLKNQSLCLYVGIPIGSEKDVVTSHENAE